MSRAVVPDCLMEDSITIVYLHGDSALQLNITQDNCCVAGHIGVSSGLSLLHVILLMY